MKKRLLLIFIGLIVASGVSAEDSAGIVLKVSIVKGCEGTDSSCPKKPFIGKVKITKNAIVLVGEFETDGAGEKKITLPPGRYSISFPEYRSSISNPENTSVVVYPEKFTSVTVFLH